MLVVGDVVVVRVAMHEDGRQLGGWRPLDRPVVMLRRRLVNVMPERVRQKPDRFGQGCGDREKDDRAEFLQTRHEGSLVHRAGRVKPVRWQPVRGEMV